MGYLLLVALVSEQWKNKFIRNIRSSPESKKYWPIMNSTRCHCAYWIKREKQAQLFEEENLKRLEKVHENIHALAHTLQCQYQEGDIDAAREGLKELQSAFDQLSNALERC